MINKKLIQYNHSSRNGQAIEYIVIHDTGNPRVGADAEAHYKYFNGGDRQASAHYFVDDKQILQVVEDSQASWHCGDGKGKYGITNQNSIGVEICVNGDYDKAVANAIELTKQLMGRYNIVPERVVRHYDASRKTCPGAMSNNNWARWQAFKKALEVRTVTCTIDIKGTKFPGYLEGGRSYFGEGVAVVDVVRAISPTTTWDDKNRIAIIR